MQSPEQIFPHPSMEQNILVLQAEQSGKSSQVGSIREDSSYILPLLFTHCFN